ncbi:MAG: class I SAM-dependent methyltransferase [Bdellovibrionales bacterium]
MHEIPPHDPGRVIDWGKTSEDYAKFRPGPPESFYRRLAALDIGLPGQRLLDLGTGTGVLARTFAKRGVQISATDISDEQIRVAKELAAGADQTIDFRVAAAENQPYSDHGFDVITANQCWLYFDKARIIPEVKRLLRSEGLLVTSHLSWLPREDEIARATESLVLKFNPQWTAGNFSGVIPPFPHWAEKHFRLRAMFYYDEQIPFTIETWRGRIRACRGIGASLTPEEVQLFDEAHEKMLRELVGERFTVLHRMDAHVFEPI